MISVLKLLKNSNKHHVIQVRITLDKSESQWIKKTCEIKKKKTGPYHFLNFSNQKAQILSKWLMVKVQKSIALSRQAKSTV